MKKVLFALLAVVVLASSLVVSTSAAEIPTDGLIGNFHFDGNAENAVDGTSGTPITTQFGDPLYELDDPDRYWFTGVNGGKAFYCADGDGLQTINPGEGDFSVGIWIIETAHTGITPYVWYGQHTQSTEAWIGIWNVDISQGWAQNGITLGSNDASGARLEVVPTEEAALYDAESEIELQWTHFAYTAVLDEETNTYTVTFYVNGVNAGSKEGLPNPSTGDPETNGDYIYLNGVNAWGDHMSSGAMDELVVYNRALSDDEVATLYSAYGTPKTYESLADWEADVVAPDAGDDPVEADPADEPSDDKKDDESKADDKAEGESTTVPTTEEPKEEGGCGSAMGAAAAIVALVSVFGCAIIKKH